MQNQTEKKPGVTDKPSGEDRAETALLNRINLSQNQPTTHQIDERPAVEPLSYLGNAFLGKVARLQLEVEGHTETPIHITVTDQLVIGRGAPNAPTNPDLDLTRYAAFRHGVSRRHAVLTKEGTLLKITDLGSTNGTYLNNFQLKPHQPRLLRSGDRLSLGRLVVKVLSLT